MKSLLSTRRKVTIEGNRIIIRPITINEVTEEYVSWLNDPEINRYLEARHSKQNRQSVIDYINNLRLRENCEMFAIFSKNANKHIGTIGVTEYDLNNNRAAYGIMIGERNMFGVGAEAMILIINYLFHDKRIEKISVGVLSENKNSYRTCEQIGFKKEGTLRKHYKLSSGEFCDGILYGMLRNEWEAQKKRLEGIIRWRLEKSR